MKKNQHFILNLIAVVSISTANPSVHEYNSVNEIIDIVLKANPDLQVYLLQQDKAIVDYAINKNYQLPNISLTMSAQNNLALSTTSFPTGSLDQTGESIDIQIGAKYNYNTGINLSKTLFDRENKLKAKISKLNIKINKYQTEVFKQTLIEQAAFYYYSSLIGEQATKLSNENLSIGQKIYDLTERKYEKGIIDLSKKNKALISLNKAKQSLLSNHMIHKNSIKSLKILMGLNNETELNFPENIIAATPAKISDISLKVDTNINLLQLKYEQSELAVKKSKAAFLPKVSINGYFGKQQLNENFDIPFNNGWSDYSYVSINFSMPLFSGFTYKNKLKLAKIDNDISAENLSIEKYKLIINDRQMIEDYQIQLKILFSSSNNYQLSKENVILMELNYQQGIISLDNYLKSYDDYLTAQNNYLNRLSNTYSQYATILSRL